MRLPTQLTVLRIALVPVFFVLFAIVRPAEIGWAVVVFAVAAASDWWDGYMARAMNLTSPLGAFLDPLADKLLTGAAFVAFAWNGYIPWWMVGVVFARDVFVTVLRSRVERQGLPLMTSQLAKVKTFAQMSLILLVLAALLATQTGTQTTIGAFGRSFFAEDLPLWLMGLVTLLTFASAVLYGYDNWPALRGAQTIVRRTGQESV